MDEIEDEIKDHFAEHQLKIEMVQIMQDELNDLSGANKPIEVKLFGPDQRELRQLAEEVGEMLEKKGKGRGIKEVNSNVYEGNPDLMIQVDGVWAARLGLTPEAVERQLQAMFLGQIATQVRESSLRITDVRVRYPDALRFGRGRFDADRVLRAVDPAARRRCADRPPSRRRSAAGRPGAGRAAVGPGRRRSRCARPTSSTARTSSRPSS